MKKNANSPRPWTPAVSQKVAAPLVFGMALLLSAAYSARSEGGFLWSLDRQVLDEFHGAGRKTVERADVMILGMDDASQRLDSLWPEEIAASPALQDMQKRPWPRTVWAHLLDRLFAAGARLVFLDITFKGQSLDPAEDAQLRAALERHRGRVILGGNFEAGSGGRATWSRATFTAPAATVLEPGQADDALGYLNFWDENGVVRKLSLWGSLQQAELHYVLAQPLTAARRREVEQQMKNELAATPADARPAIALLLAQKMTAGKMATPGREKRLRFGESFAYAPISLHEVFVPGLWENNFASGEAFRDKVILVGATATDLQDFHQTPVGRIAGVQLHAHALAAVLTGAFLDDAPACWWWASILGGALLAWLLVTFVRQPIACLLLLWLLCGGVTFAVWWAFNHWNVEASPVPGVLALNLCGLVGLSGNYFTQMRETRQLRRFLARYTSPELVDEMLNDRAGIYTTLSGAERPVTILFSDVRGFTSMSEGMQAGEVVAQLNEYLSRMVEQAFKHRGVVDKFIGDAVMALWGSLRTHSVAATMAEDSRQAVAAALAMRKALRELNAVWRERGMGEFNFGVGIHHGPVVVGNIGSESPYEKMDITVIGDNVNLASRLEGVTKEYGVDLIISSTVRELVGDAFICRSADLVRVKGKVLPVEVFAVPGAAGDPVPPGLQEYEEGVRQYRKGDFKPAHASFEQAQRAGLDDTLTRMYLDRCAALMASPPGSWDGVYVMKNK